GQPLSHFHTRARAATADAAGANAPAIATLFSLEPAERSWLHARIAQRFDAMLDAGLVAEVAGLRARGDLHADLPSMRCVGYRQVWDEMDWQTRRGGELNRHLLREKGIAATRQLAKRQITWLRSMPQRQVIACDAADATPALVQAVLDHLAAHRN
ncbi:MAG: tRNA (adenosine(37)-N6)-dimethylallyltransferase MiaA, partial [Comamonas sp.]